MADNEVVNNEAEGRYELSREGAVAIAAYRREGEIVRFTHTVVPEALEGRGIGSALIKGALEDVRSHGLKVIPLCSFVEHYISAHPETQDLLG